MDTNTSSKKWTGILLVVTVFVVAGLGIAIHLFASGKFARTANNPTTQKTFGSPALAAAALLQAAAGGDTNALAQVLGNDAKVLITSGDNESDKAGMDGFVSKFRQMNRWVDMTDGSRVLYIGADNFAFPVPLAKNSSGQWYFDGVAGAQEIRARNIGRNELLAIDACGALANAEELYFVGTGQFAQRIVSGSGQQDGLYWPMSESDGASPLGHLSKFPKTSLATYSADQPFVIDGYTLRILTSQGDDAQDGARNYISNGQMTGGFAVLATPVKYAETGIMTFTISREGVVYERDFGPETVKIASSIEQYNPDDNWSPIE